MSKEEMIKVLRERYAQCKKGSKEFDSATLKASYQGEMLGIGFALDLLLKED